MQPFNCGRTGLLRCRLSEPYPPPSSTRCAKKLHAPPVKLKWNPTSAAVVPYRLLYHFLRDGGEVPSSFGVFLLMQSMADGLCRALFHSSDSAAAVSTATHRMEEAHLLRALLQWHRELTEAEEEEDSTLKALEATVMPPSVGLSWYLPCYTLVVMKDGVRLTQLPEVGWRGTSLIGKDPTVNDIVIDHPSCSGQHAALQTSFVQLGWEEEVWELARDICAAHPSLKQSYLANGNFSNVSSSDGDPMAEQVGDASLPSASSALKELYREVMELVRGMAGTVSSAYSLELQIVDLNSTNGTRVNHDETPLRPFVPYTLAEGDCVSFGVSSRTYVLMRGGGGGRE